MNTKESVEYLGQNGKMPLRTAGAFPLGMDSMVLAEFVSLRPGCRVFDLGCGPGTLLLLLFLRQPLLTAGGIELQPAAAALARENLSHNGLSGCVSIAEGDLRTLPQSQAPGQWDLVVSNPPYFAPGRGAAASNPQRAAARTGTFCTPLELCKTASHLLHPRGRFALVLRPERLEEWILALHSAGLTPKRLRCVHHTAAHPPSMILLESVRLGKTGLSILPPLLAADWNRQRAAQRDEPFHKQSHPEHPQEEPI